MGIAGGREYLLLAFASQTGPLAEGGAENRPHMGRESIMSARIQRPAATDLHALLALVAGPAQPPEALFADWEKARKSADVDALILAWIASHVPGSAHRGRLH
jgi:hypothetical protein